MRSQWKHLRLKDTREGHLIFHNNRLVPPRPAIYKVLHSHMLPQTWKKNAVSHYFWPGMAADVKKKAESCQACRLYKKSNSQTKGIIPLELQEVLPGEAWSLDVLTYKGCDYLVAVCMVSSFTWIVKLRRKGAKDLASALWHFVCHWVAPSLL